MRKKTLSMISIAAVTFICTFAIGGCGSGNSADFVDSAVEKVEKTVIPETERFREDIAGSVGDHIIYSYNLFEGRKLEKGEKEEIIAYLEKADKKLTEDIYVTGSIRMSHDNSLKFSARQCVNGAVTTDVWYATDYTDPDPNICIADGVPLADIDTSAVVNVKDLIPVVVEKANAHQTDLYDYSEKGLYGSYLLTYDNRKDMLVYDFTVNETSHVYFDALSGDVIDVQFWNGEIYD